MGLKSWLAKPYASFISGRINRWSLDALRAQEYMMHSLVQSAKNTGFGKEHGFGTIQSYEDFVKQIPLRTYEELLPYIERVKKGEEHVLWKGKPVYLAKSSGTTAGIKYIPVTKESVPNHIETARNALLMYIHERKNAEFVDGKMIFLSGSPELDNMNGILTGRLSGIVNHHVPKYLKKNQLPSYETNCIEDWEEKVNRIVDETYNQKMTLVSGIPPWVQMYFDKLLEKTGKKTIKEIFPSLQLLVYGGVNFDPYRAKLMNTVGGEIDTIETYPASEGFIAFQDNQNEPGLLLNVDAGIFFEFVRAGEIFSANPVRLTLKDVELGVNYALIINSNAGLWGYVIGDTAKFISKNPYRLLVTGRINHFISAFGEHVIAEEVEGSIKQVISEFKTEVIEFTVAPKVKTESNELPYHEWLIEFADPPESVSDFAKKLDDVMCEKNIYYRDLIEGHILQKLKIRVLPKDTFRNFMKSKGKLGGQNKVPRLGNDRMLADKLVQFLSKE